MMLIAKLQSLLLKNRAFTVTEVAQTLDVTNHNASILLSRYARQGKIKRIKQGTYIPVSERFLSPDESFSNPWIIVPTVFPEAYIGGWSAASHWGFTDQLFETTCILTPRKIRHSSRVFSHFLYKLFKINENQNFGTELIWQDQTKVSISDPHKTIIDMLENPKCGAGIQNTIDCFKVYISEHFKEATFLIYAQKMKNGIFFKRLGFLSEQLLGPNNPICLLAHEKMSKGPVPIDSNMKCPKLITKWNLFIPKDFKI